MEFNNDNDFGIVGVESVGEPQLFSQSAEDIAPIETQDSDDTIQGFELGEESTPMLFAKEEDESPQPKKEEDKKVSEEVVEPAPPDPEPQDEPINEVQIIFDTLVDQGLLLALEEGQELPQSKEELLTHVENHFAQKTNETLNTFLGKFGQDRIDFFNAVFVNGVNPKDYFTVEQKLNSVKGIDLELLENQEMVIAQHYKELGWSNEKVKKYLKRLDEDGETEAEATEAHQALLQKEEENLRQVVANQTRQAQQKQQERAFYNQQIGTILQEKLKTKDFDGIPLTDKVSRETADFLTTIKWGLPDGTQLTDFDKWMMDLNIPENYETKVKVALLIKNGFNFEKITKKAISKESNKLFEGLQRKEIQKTTNNEPEKQKIQGFTL